MTTTYKSWSTLIGMLLLLALSCASTALAQDGDTDASVRVRAAEILPGDNPTVTGRGFAANQQLTLTAQGTQLNTQPIATHADGSFRAPIEIPAQAQTGPLTVAVHADGDVVTRFQLQVSKQLPLSGGQQFAMTQKPLPQGLYQAAYSAANTAVYVTRAVGHPPVTQSQILRINPQTLNVVDSTTPPAVAPPDAHEDAGKQTQPLGVYAVYGITADSAHHTLWVTNTVQNTVAVYRQDDLSLLKQFRPGLVPHARSVVVAAAQDKAYVTSIGGGFVAVFDTNTLQHVKNIEIDANRGERDFVPMGLTLDTASGTLYVSSMQAPAVAVIDTATDTVKKVLTLEHARSLRDLAWDAADELLLAASYGNDRLLIIDPASGDLVHNVYVGAGTLSVTWEPASGLAYVSNRGAGTMTVVNPASGERVANLDAGTFPNHVIADGKGHVFAINKSRGADDPNGDLITRITPQAD